MASGHKKRLKTLRLLGNKKRLKRLEERLEKRLEKRLKRLWVRIGESETAEVNQCWSVVASMG